MENDSYILVDCESSEVKTFVEGLESTSRRRYTLLSKRTNSLHGSKVKTLKRYLKYFTYPLSVLRRHRDARLIVGWQQFYAINYAFFCRLFRVRRDVRVVAVNYTYKRKGGLLGSIYHRYMRYAVNNRYVAGLHVLSNSYARQIADELGVPLSKLIVTYFGTPDRSARWSQLRCPYDRFVVSIGRSNRDFDLLVRLWRRPEIEATGQKLIILSDTWHPAQPLPEGGNIIHRTDVKGDDSFSYFANCDFQIVPISDGSICSGDTVLLNSMMMSKPVVVTAPSTLSEMYVEDDVNGLYIDADEERSARVLHRLITDETLRQRLGAAARESYVNRFSRTRMGADLGVALAQL